MRNTGTRGYSGYRGRRGGRKWLIALLTLILFVALGFLFVQRYLVYGMDGSYRFEFPWIRRAPSGVSPEQTSSGTAQNLEIVIEQPKPSEVAERELHARELDVSVLQGGMEKTLAALPDGVNAVAVRVKNESGDLLYNSALPAAIEAKAVAGSSIARAAIGELTASDLYAIARLSALHDSRFSYAHMTDAAIQQINYKNYIWYAPDSSFYLAPEKELTREYLASVAAEVASLGFDELLFDEYGYPSKGRLDNIKTDAREMTMEAALALLADALREALRPYEVRLSVELDAQTVLNGANTVTGQELASLASLFDRVYVPAPEERLDELRAALAPYDAEFIPILKEPPAEGPFLLAP